MASTRRFRPFDLFSFNQVNLDKLTETYSLGFYYQYMQAWPEFQQVIYSPDHKIMSYILGKTEGVDTKWHGHVSAVTVAPEYRRMGLAKKLMNYLERLSDDVNQCYFVDLFVRKSNLVAINMYERFGYVVYRTILGYYDEGKEDAYDMRKALKRDKDKRSMIPIKHPVDPRDIELTM